MIFTLNTHTFVYKILIDCLLHLRLCGECILGYRSEPSKYGSFPNGFSNSVGEHRNRSVIIEVCSFIGNDFRWPPFFLEEESLNLKWEDNGMVVTQRILLLKQVVLGTNLPYDERDVIFKF